MRIKDLTLLVLLNSQFQFALLQEQTKIDSLLICLEKTTEDTTKVNLLNKLSEEYQSTDPEKAEEYASKALLHAEKKGYKKGAAKSYRMIGIILQRQGSYNKAVEYHQKALSRFEEIADQYNITESLLSIGTIYYLQSNYDNAYEFYQRALKVYEVIRDTIGISTCYVNIGAINSDQGNYSRAIKYFEKAMLIMKEVNDKKGISYCYNNIGNVYYYQGKYDKAHEFIEKSLKIKKELGDKKGISYCYNNIGNIYCGQCIYNKAIENYEKSIIIKRELSDKLGISNCFINIAEIHFAQGNYDKAAEYYEKSLNIKKEIGSKRGIPYCYYNLGVIALEQNNYQEVSVHINNAMRISNEIGDKSNYAISVSLLGELHLKQGNYKEAMLQFEKSLKIHKELGEEDDVAYSYNKIGEIYFELNNYNKAIENCLRGFKIAQETGSKDYLNQAAEILAKSYAKLNDFENAYAYHVIFKEIQDSIFTIESKKKIAAVESRFELDRKEQEIILQQAELDKKDIALKQQQIRQRALIGGSVAVFIVMGLIIYIIHISQQRKEHKLKEALYMNMQQSLSQQMNPHFIFNTLNSIQNFIYKNKPEESMKYLSEFANLMRRMLHHSQNYLISLNDELEVLKAYSKLEALRFDNAFNFTIEVDKNIDMNSSKIPVFLLQPLVENAIKHGLEPVSGKGTITLKINKNRDGVICLVEDSGAGQNSADETKKKEGHLSVATKLIRKRLDILSMYYKKEFQFRLNELKSETGAVLGSVSEISIPVFN
ncbi:MAG: tetratricopeptide repeat protein [Bacteroidales bacterium]|nr:tetratricopeptide repeat protein [Bacteroidales bacterium]